VCLVQGLRAEDLASGDTPFLGAIAAAQGTRALLAEPLRAGCDQLFEALPVDELRARGLRLDRRSWAMRADWQGDRACVEQLALRPHGPADVVCLWLRDAARAAVRCGLGSAGHRQALRDLDAHAREAAEHLSRGAPPTVVLLTLAPLVPVAWWFDAKGALLRALPRRLRQELAVEQRLSHLHVKAATLPAARAALHACSGGALAEHGRVVTHAELDALGAGVRPTEVVFVPRAGGALSRGKALASACFPPDPAGAGAASLPWSAGVSTPIAVAQVAAELTAQLRLAMVPVEDVAAEAPATGVPGDLLALLGADLERVLAAHEPAEE
jgi:hypothetical protein